MKITILCSATSHPVNAYLKVWATKHQEKHQIDIIQTKAQLSRGDLLFLISCSEILSETDRRSYANTLVIHASDLPHGRGWSPHIWQLLNGATEITLTLLEAASEVDSGAIWKKERIPVSKDALWDEINHAIFQAELTLMDFATENCADIDPTPQDSASTATYLPKRTPSDSELDPTKSIAEQFNLMRVCDPNRFPAYFVLHGHKYTIRMEKS